MKNLLLAAAAAFASFAAVAQTPAYGQTKQMNEVQKDAYKAQKEADKDRNEAQKDAYKDQKEADKDRREADKDRNEAYREADKNRREADKDHGCHSRGPRCDDRTPPRVRPSFHGPFGRGSRGRFPTRVPRSRLVRARLRREDGSLE